MRVTLLAVLILLLSSCKKNEDDVLILEIPEQEMLQNPIGVRLNPNGITPLAAEVTFQSHDSSTVEVMVDGAIPLSFQIDQATTDHQFALVGLYPDTLNQVYFKITNDKGQFFQDTLEILTSPLPDHFPSIEIVQANPNLMEPGMNLCEFNIGDNGKLKTQPILFDHQGFIRWYIDLGFTEGWTAPLNKLQNGNLVFARGHHFYEYDWLGKQINQWTHWGFFQHHDLIEIPNGNFIIPVSQDGLDSGLDQIIEIDRATSTVIRQWDLREVLDVDRFDLLWQSWDWIHVNSVWYDERDEGLLISGRNQGIFKVSKENELLWILAPHKGWGKAGVDGNGHLTADYLLTAIDDNGFPYESDIQEGISSADSFDWSWGQHAASFLPNGHILIFDNGWKRHFEHAGQSGISRAVEYAIDLDARTVQQVWAYGKDRNQETFSENISNVIDLPQTGNRLFCPGNIQQPGLVAAKVVEVTFPGQEVVFEANIRFKNTFSTGSGWGHTDLVYRSKRMLMY